MPVVIIVGGQWGDEGKGKVVDYLTEKAAVVVRFQGGNNAGHTVVVNGKKTALKLVPSGILHPHTRCLLAAAVVVDPEALLSEIDSLESSGIKVTPNRLGLAGEVNMILPYHKAIDAERERALAAEKIGTTGRGIGPAYEDLVSRYGVRLADLFHPTTLRAKLERNIEDKNEYLRSALKSSISFDAKELFQSISAYGERLKPYVCDVSLEVHHAIAAKKKVIFEGAQGTLLDIMHGTYPFVTSSNTIAAEACVSAGFDPRKIDRVVGILKAYCTRVGSGPFPTEDTGAHGDRLRERGVEFGTVTGRPRRCGWFDLAAARRAVRLNGIDSIILTKLDVLDGLDSIRICQAYDLDGTRLEEMPASAEDLSRAKPIYEEVPGWKQKTSGAKSVSELPPEAQHYIELIERQLESEIVGISVGPERDQTLIQKDLF